MKLSPTELSEAIAVCGEENLFSSLSDDEVKA